MNWYTIYRRRTGELVASGTAEMCARQLGFASRNSFYSSLSHHKKKYPSCVKLRKYDFVVEPLTPEEVRELQPKKKSAQRCWNTDERTR